MAYSDFINIAQLEKQFGIQQTIGKLFQQSPTIQPSEHLQVDLADMDEMPLINSEKAKSEFLIVPILKEIRRRNRHFSIFSGYTFDVDREQSLVGICDYILSNKIDSLEIKSYYLDASTYSASAQANVDVFYKDTLYRLQQVSDFTNISISSYYNGRISGTFFGAMSYYNANTNYGLQVTITDGVFKDVKVIY